MQLQLKRRITTGWTLMRGLRFLLAAAILVSAIKTNDGLIMMGGGFLVMQSILGIGCAGGNCSVDSYEDNNNKEVAFEEIKQPENINRK